MSENARKTVGHRSLRAETPSVRGSRPPSSASGTATRPCRGQAGEAGGHPAFWQAVEWVYVHTHSDGQGLPEDLRHPALTPAIEQCIASERPDAAIRTQTAEATNSGVTATPSLRLHDRETGKAILLQGPIEGDALLSAMDMLAAGDPAATPTSEMPADVVGDMPR